MFLNHGRLGHGGGHLGVHGDNSCRTVVVLYYRRAAQLRVHHGVGEALGQDVQGQHGQQDGDAGEGGGPPAAGQDQVAAVGNDVAPGRCGVLDAGAQEGQRGFEDDGVGHHDRGEHQHGSGGVADDVLDQDVETAGADHAFGTDVVFAVLGQHVGADHAGQLRGVDDGDRDDDGGHRVAERCQQHGGQGDAGERHEDVHEPHDDLVHGLAGGGREGTEERTGKDGQGNRAEADHQRGLRAEQEAGEDVAAQAVGAEEVFGARRGGRNEGLQRIVRGDDRREDGGQDDHDEEEQGDAGAPGQGLETNARGT